MTIYRVKANYNTLISYSFDALKGIAGAGWCSPVLVSQTPLIYDLYYDRHDEDPSIRPGIKFGKFELRHRPNGEGEIIFYDETPRIKYKREWADNEIEEGNNFLTREERLSYTIKILKKIDEEKKDLQRKMKEHLGKVIREYFGYLEYWDVLPNAKGKDLVTKWDKLKPATRERYTIAWKIYLKMTDEYSELLQDGKVKYSKPTIADWQVRVAQDLKKNGSSWAVTERTLETVKAFGEAGIISKKKTAKRQH